MKQAVVVLIQITYLTYLFAKVLGRIITLGVLIPHNGSRSMGPEAEAAVKLAVYKVVCFYIYAVSNENRSSYFRTGTTQS